VWMAELPEGCGLDGSGDQGVLPESSRLKISLREAANYIVAGIAQRGWSEQIKIVTNGRLRASSFSASLSGGVRVWG